MNDDLLHDLITRESVVRSMTATQLDQLRDYLILMKPLDEYKEAVNNFLTIVCERPDFWSSEPKEYVEYYSLIGHSQEDEPRSAEELEVFRAKMAKINELITKYATLGKEYSNLINRLDDNPTLRSEWERFQLILKMST